MKQTLLALIVIFTTASIYGQNFKHYQVKSGIVKYQVEGTANGTEILYFDNFGSSETKETKLKTTVMGFTQEDNQLTIINDATIFVVDCNTKTYTQMPNPLFQLNQQLSQDIKITEEFDDEMMKSIGGKMIGRETILGKSCKIWEIADMGTKTWNYKLIPLKVETNIMGIKISYIATSIEFDVPVPAEKFKLPKGLKEQKMPTMEELMETPENF